MSAALFLIDFLLGAVSAIVSKFGSAPIERAKLILQNQSQIRSIPADKRFTGLWDVLVRLPQEQGIFSYWRGTLCNLIRYFPTQAINFASKDSMKRLLKSTFGEASPVNNPGKFFLINLLSGGLAGAISLIFVYPLDFVSTRLALDMGTTDETREFSGIFDCLYKSISSDGIFSIYSGFLVSVVGIIVYRALYFGLYDGFKNIVHRDGKAGFFERFMFAQMVTIMAGMGSYPIDTIRRRLMLAVGNPQSKCTGTISCTFDIIGTEGVNGLFEGVMVNVYRGIFASLILVLWDQVVPLLKSILQASITGRGGEAVPKNERKAATGPQISQEQVLKVLQEMDNKNREFLENNLSNTQMEEFRKRQVAINDFMESIGQPTEADIKKLNESQEEMDQFMKDSIGPQKYQEFMQLQEQFAQTYAQLQMMHGGGHSHAHSHEGGCCDHDHGHEHGHANEKPAEQALADKKNS